MSNHLAIATVTAVLTDRLAEALDAVQGNARVTHLRPDEISDASVDCRKGINLYLYRISRNPALRNQDLPMRQAVGGLVQTPAAALDLHYLISFYGEDVALEPQKLLAKAAALLRAKAVFRPEDITHHIENLKARGDARYAFLDDSDLAGAAHWVRVSPEDMTLDELSRIWSIFFKTKYMLTVPYMAHAVVVESELRAAPVRPLQREPRVDVHRTRR